MDWVGWAGIGIGGVGLMAAGIAQVTAVRANRHAAAANEIAERALEAQRGPEFAFVVEHAPQPLDERVFRLTNAGWRTVTGVTFEPTEPGETPWGSFSPRVLGTIDSMVSGESVRFAVGMRDPYGREETVAPAFVFVRIRESDRVFRVDMPAKVS